MEKYKVEIKQSAVKEIKRLSKGDIKKVLSKIQSLTGDPRPVDSKKLSAQERYRIRLGRYRILYTIEDHILVVYIVKVGHRRDVYR